MTIELIIFSVILALSVVAHYLLWRDSKKRYTEYMKQANALRERIGQLEESNEEMDKMLDEAEEAIDRIDEGIEDLRSGMFKKKTNTTTLKN